MTISTSPAYPTVNTETTLSSDVGDAGVTVYSVTAKPTDSSLALGKLVDKQGNAIQKFTPDVAGTYTVVAYNYQELCPDPAAGIVLKPLGTTTANIAVGRTLDLPIKALNGHSVTLRITVVGSTVRAAAFVSPATDLARNATLATTVTTAVAAIVGETIATMEDDLIANANTLRTQYEAHRILVGLPAVHAVADNINQTVAKPARDVQTAVILTQDLATRITAHLMPGYLDGGHHGANWDTKNVLQVAPRCSTLAEATVLCADLRERCFDRHRLQVANPASHYSADTTNAMPPPKPLTSAIVAYLDYIANGDPTAPTGQSEGIGDAIAKLGFR